MRDNCIYLTSGLTAWMEDVWGGILTHVKTGTNTATGEVAVMKVSEQEKGAVPVRRYGTQNAAVFNFWRPLRKLALKVPADRQFNITPFTKELGGVGTVFVFPMKDRQSVPRNLKEEQEDQAQSAAKPAGKKAQAAAAAAAKPAAAPAAEAAGAKEPEAPVN